MGKYLRSLAEKRGYEVVNISRKPKTSKDLSWVSVMLMSQRSIYLLIDHNIFDFLFGKLTSALPLVVLR